jgi:cystathionine gamma-lyase
MSGPNFATKAIHVGSEPDPITGAVVPPISLATTYAQAQLGELAGQNDPNSWTMGYEYQRTGNPTRGAFERAIGAVENGKYAIAFSSGLGATTSICLTLSTGDHVICIDDVYGGTQRQFRRVMQGQFGVNFTFMDLADQAAIVAAIKPETKMLWLETPTNPTMKVTDIAKVAEAVKVMANRPDIFIVADNTFGTPYLQNPLDLGADIVMHSVTKYIGGHSDVVMGVIALNDDALYQKVKFQQNSAGATPAPFDCYMALRGLKTLHVRMEAAMKNAMTIATFLETNPQFVEKVAYPGLASHPNHDIVKKQMRGGGAMVTFFINGGLEEAGVFLKSLKLFTLAESLGAVESLAECPAVMTHASVPVEERKKLGLTDNLIRLSVGIEHIDDLLADLKQALVIATGKN